MIAEETEIINMTESLNTAIADRLQDIHALQRTLISAKDANVALDLALATATSLDIAQLDRSPVVWLLIVGAPSAGKTELVGYLEGSPSVFYVDTMTANAFSSGHKDARTGERPPDLLPLLAGKCFVTRDMGSLFGQADATVNTFLGYLTAIFDGKFTKATGTVGVISYASVFSWLACITVDRLDKHHRFMASLGPRFLFYRVPALTLEEKRAGCEMERSSTGFDELKRLVAAHIKDVQNTSSIVVLPKPLHKALFTLAMLLAKGRAYVKWTTDFNKEIEHAQEEEPFRAFHQFAVLAKALARVRGRAEVTMADVETVKRVAFSSMERLRFEVLELFASNPDGVTAEV